MDDFYKYIFLILINFLLFFNYNFFAKKINVYDKPDLKRKLHSKKTPLLGGFFLIINLFFVSIIYYNNLNYFFEFKFISQNKAIIFLLLIFLFFLLGFIDDKINLSAGQKIIYFFFLTYLIISTNELFVIKSLRFETFNKEIDLFNFSYFFSILSIVIFINALNMFDGINLQSFSYYMILFIFFLIFNFSIFNCFVVLFLIFFMSLNKDGKIFLGDSGVYILAIFSSLSLIFFYNTKSLFVEDILVLIILPILDLLRLFFLRIKNNQNPMIGDRNHIHHILVKKYSETWTIIVLSLFTILFSIIHYLLNLYFLITLSGAIITYFLFLKDNR